MSAIEEIGGITPALRECLDFSHAWIVDPVTCNIIIGRLADDNWPETMHLAEAKARADYEHSAQTPNELRANSFRNEMLLWLAKAPPEEILRVKTLLMGTSWENIAHLQQKVAKEKKPEIDWLKLNASASVG